MRPTIYEKNNLESHKDLSLDPSPHPAMHDSALLEARNAFIVHRDPPFGSHSQP